MTAAALAGGSACATHPLEIPSWRGPSLAHQQQILSEAEAFMTEYARRLLAGDRSAVAALYDPDGAILIQNGRLIDASYADIAQRYAGESWRPPARFDWQDLHFEAAGAEAVVVIGKFIWDEGDGSPARGTYHALLRREDGRLVIRIEDEAVDHFAR